MRIVLSLCLLALLLAGFAGGQPALAQQTPPPPGTPGGPPLPDPDGADATALPPQLQNAPMVDPRESDAIRQRLPAWQRSVADLTRQVNDRVGAEFAQLAIAQLRFGVQGNPNAPIITLVPDQAWPRLSTELRCTLVEELLAQPARVERNAQLQILEVSGRRILTASAQGPGRIAWEVGSRVFNDCPL